MQQDQAAASQVKKKPSDFVFGKVIGEGSFSTVSCVGCFGMGIGRIIIIVYITFVVDSNNLNYKTIIFITVNICCFLHITEWHLCD